MCRLYAFLFCCFTLCSAWCTEPPVVIAHRGGAWGVENSLSCIAKCLAMGVEAVEVDVRVTRDSFLVVFHDARVDDLTDGRGKISSMTLAEVQALRLLDTAGRVTDERVPTLEQILAFVGGRCRLLIEVKDGSCGVEERLIDVINRYSASGWVGVQSFSDAVLEKLYKLGAPFELEKLFVFKIPFLPVIFDGSLSLFSMKKYHYISSFNINTCCLNAVLVRAMHKAGKRVKVWTPDAPCDVPSLPVDGVITDYPWCWSAE